MSVIRDVQLSLSDISKHTRIMKMLKYFEVSDEIQLNCGNVGVFLGVRLSLSDISKYTCIMRMSVYFVGCR